VEFPDLSARRPSLVRRKHRVVMLITLAACLILTACGSRRPMSDFVAAGTAANGGTQVGQTQNGGSSVQGGSASGPATTTGLPSAGSGGTSTGGSGGTTGPGATSSSGNSSQGTQSGNTSGTGGPNTASDAGVTATTINLGNIVTKSGSFGPDQFTAFYYGAAAYFDYVNAHGGINGRKVVFNTCDDQGTSAGNNDCARNLAGNGKNGVFAFVANDCLVCSGLKYISDLKIPQVGGLAIDFYDYALPYVWRYSGEMYPTDGKHIGYKGNLYEGTQMFHYFKAKMGMTKAGVVWYSNSAQSSEAGQSFMKALQAEGVTAYGYAENVALPQWDSAVLSMKSKGVQFMFDSIDIGGNQNLCKSIDSNHLVLKAKVSTISTWSQSVGSTFDAPCRNYIYSSDVPGTLGYDETSNPEIAKFRAAMKQYFPEREGSMFEWNVDGWASAMWFADAASSCGADLTRDCVIKFLNSPKPYGARGIWYPRNNEKYNFETKKTLSQCVTIAHWDDAKQTFVTVGDWHNTCYTTPYIPYQAPAASSS
jgi:branched-chain amino acid transport system substrate-binding protein